MSRGPARKAYDSQVALGMATLQSGNERMALKILRAAILLKPPPTGGRPKGVPNKKTDGGMDRADAVEFVKAGHLTPTTAARFILTSSQLFIPRHQRVQFSEDDIKRFANRVSRDLRRIKKTK